MTNQQNIFTVSRLNSEVRYLLENNMGVVWLVGEISNFSAPHSGHWYFTLKDTHSQIKCAMFRGNSRFVTFSPANGNQVLVRARVSLYEPRGDFQIIVESMQPEGDGLLKQQYEQLKAQLAAEGLFSTAIKKPLPAHPKRIGIVTSKTGAALHDILQVLKRREPSLAIVIYPTQVQGKIAATSIASSIALANARQECDVLIVGRGGGSLEDLWCFNEEIVARAIFASNIPIISAVGHEVDVTISDYAADVRAPTPSAAAELVSQDESYKRQQLAAKYAALQRSIERILSLHNSKFTGLDHRLTLSHPRTKLQQQAQRFDELERRLQQALTTSLHQQKMQLERALHRLEQHNPVRLIENKQNTLKLATQRLQDAMQQSLRKNQYQLAVKMETLNAVSPLATLNRGYSISLDQDRTVLRSTQDTHLNQKLITILPDGEIHSIVKKII